MTIVKDDLSEADYNRYDAANKALDSIIVLNLFTYYGDAYGMLVELWEEACNTFSTSLPIMGLTDSVATTATRLRGAVLNVVSMLCYHQERTLDEVCDKYGHDTEQHVEVKRIFNELFDNYSGYRFLYKLRNIMVHNSMEAVSLTATTYRNNGQPFTDLRLTLDRKIFLDSTKVNTRLKDELSSKPEDPNVLEMLIETAKPLVKANGKLLAVLHPDLSALCETVLEFDNLFEGKPGTRGLVHQMSPKLETTFQAGFTPWSDRVFGFARRYATEGWTNLDDN